MTPPADATRDKNHRFPGDIMSHGVWRHWQLHGSTDHTGLSSHEVANACTGHT
jgi:hypothetical protein